MSEPTVKIPRDELSKIVHRAVVEVFEQNRLVLVDADGESVEMDPDADRSTDVIEIPLAKFQHFVSDLLLRAWRAHQLVRLDTSGGDSGELVDKRRRQEVAALVGNHATHIMLAINNSTIADKPEPS